jgi:anaerobic selenocysteine-containing dehydrogenase
MMTEPQRSRTACTFCRCGCELEIVRDGRRIVGVEYPPDAATAGGRLCPRGSASAMLLDHPRRLGYPLKDGKERTWSEFFAETEPVVKACPGSELAITYDRNLTGEETALVWGLADALGTDNLACANPDAETQFARQLEGRGQIRSADRFQVTADEIRKADSVLLVGDVFGLMPVLAKPILDARYAGRERRLFCLDAIRTRAFGFAHRSLWTRPGMEALSVLGLAALIDPKLSGFDAELVAAACGVKAEDIREVAAGFERPRRGLVLATMSSGRSAHPQFLATALQLLVNRMKGNKRLVCLTAGSVEPGRQELGKILAGIEEGRIRAMLNFGDGALFDYADLARRLDRLELLVTTATLRPGRPVKGWVLPVPLNLEKTGTASSIWGVASLVPGAEPASGVRTVAEIASGIARTEIRPAELPAEHGGAVTPTKLLTDWGRTQLRSAGTDAADAEHPFTLLAERPAYGFQALFTASGAELSVSRADATKLDLSDGAVVKVQTAAVRGQAFRARVTDQVAPGVLVADGNLPEVRALFDVGIDSESGIVTIPPVKVKLWRSE